MFSSGGYISYRSKIEEVFNFKRCLLARMKPDVGIRLGGYIYHGQVMFTSLTLYICYYRVLAYSENTILMD
jgi:hypothetical protein